MSYNNAYWELLKKPQWISYNLSAQDTVVGYCIAYDDSNRNEFRILVWFLENEMDFSVIPWSFKSRQETRPVWTRRWVSVESDSNNVFILEDNEVEEMPPIPINFNHKDRIIRVCGDRITLRGDQLFYPIWTLEQPNIDNAVRTDLLKTLLQLNEECKDYQIVTPVEDIIDPDLGPHRILTGGYIARQLEHFDKLEKIGVPEIWQERRNFNDDMKDINLSEAVKIRETYHWLPSEFLVKADGSVRILSRIHNLPPQLKYSSTYNQIAKIFEGMVPMFKNLYLIKENQDTNLQVIVKAQSYRLEPGMTYAGRWHVEGRTENIVGVGVYYLQVDEGLSGGNLKFRPAESPQEYTSSGSVTVDLPVEQGSAVVFSNIIPHRFRKIYNKTDEVKRRTFLNFFIVDPNNPLTTTKTLPTSSFLKKCVKKAAGNYGIDIPKPVLKLIISFLPGIWNGTTAAKRFRKEAREAMTTDKSGWGWGNSGTMEFVPAFSAWGTIRQKEHQDFTHTDSN